MRAPRARPGYSGRRMLWCACGDRSPGGGPAARRSARAPLALAQRLVLAQQQVEVRALLVCELEEDLFALRVLEALAIAFEEFVRAALATDADAERLLIVDALAQFFGSLGEEAAGGALEEQKGRSRLELRIAGGEVCVALLQCAEMLAFFGGELLEHRAAARILRQRR